MSTTHMAATAIPPMSMLRLDDWDTHIPGRRGGEDGQIGPGAEGSDRTSGS